MKTVKILLAEAREREAQAASDRKVLEVLTNLDPDSLSRAIALLNGTPASNGSVKSNGVAPAAAAASASTPTMSDAVREAVASMNGQFSAFHVRQYIASAYPALEVDKKANAVSALLSTLAKRKKLIKLGGAPGAASTFERNN